MPPPTQNLVEIDTSDEEEECAAGEAGAVDLISSNEEDNEMQAADPSIQVEEDEEGEAKPNNEAVDQAAEAAPVPEPPAKAVPARAKAAFRGSRRAPAAARKSTIEIPVPAVAVAPAVEIPAPEEASPQVEIVKETLPSSTKSATGGIKRPAEPTEDEIRSRKAPKKEKEKDRKGEEAKPAKIGREEMEKKVLQYMQTQNRPYNVQNVFDNLHNVVPKGQCLAILDAMTSTGVVRMKEYGKTKVYLAMQNNSEGLIEAEAAKLEASIKDLNDALGTARTKAESASKKCEALKMNLAVVSKAASAKETLSTAKIQLADLQGSASAGVNLDEKVVEQVEEKFRTAHAEWRRRKRLCMNVLNTLSERTDAKVSTLLEKYGVETDEECDQIYPIIALP